MDSFQEIIKEDIRELIKENPCQYCNNFIAYDEIGSFHHGCDNPLDLAYVVCSTCWGTNYHRVKNEKY